MAVRLAVVGAGAIGGVTAAFMRLGGCDVTLVCRRESAAVKISSEGLHITGLRGDRHASVPAVGSIEGLSGEYDYILIATKAPDAPDCARRAIPFLSQNGVMLFLQNGVSLEAQLETAGDRAACCVVTWSCTSLGEARLEITGEGGFTIGMLSGGSGGRLDALGAALEHMAPTVITDEILPAMYSKLIINSGITCGGALTGQRLGKIFAIFLL